MNDFLDSAHVEYDVSVRKMAETMGFEAFASSKTGSSVLHYGAQNMRVKKVVSGVSDFKHRVPGGKASKVALGRRRTVDSTTFAQSVGVAATRGPVARIGLVLLRKLEQWNHIVTKKHARLTVLNISSQVAEMRRRSSN